MSSSQRRKRGWRVAAVCLPLAASLAHAGDHKEGVVAPAYSITLNRIGAPLPAARMLSEGASVMTVHLIDDTHLLVTYATRGLVPRRPDASPTDDDRILGGEVVELPSGKVLANTTWHVHDHARYLWSLGQGRFVFRIGSDLSVMAPLAHLGESDPFQRIALPHAPGFPLGIVTEPDTQVFSVITQEPPARQDGVKVVLGDNNDNLPKPTYAVNFFRMSDAGGGFVQYAPAGVLRADIPLVMPMDGDGYLWAEDDGRGRGRWMVTFNTYAGKELPAGVVDSSCVPRMKLISRSEYLAITCQGTDTNWKLRSMGFDGTETWEEDFDAFTEAPSFAYAPAAGRFAISRTWTATAPGDMGAGSLTTTNEEVRVYQNVSGDLVAKVPLSPMFRVPENFDLSADGRVLVTVHGDSLDVYALPEPNKRDKADIAEVAALAPPVGSGEVKLARLFAVGSTKAAEGAPASAKQALSAPLSTTTAAPVAAPASAAAGNEGDVQQVGPRKRPTLLNPGEKPEFQDKNAPPQ